MTSDTASFDRFAQLPLELRRLIWSATLPEDDLPTIHHYGWMAEARYDKALLHEVTSLPVQVPLPELFFVSREARDVARLWATKHDYTIRYRGQTRGHILVREWQPEKDALYVARRDWDEFLELRDGLRHLGSAIRHLAVPSFTGYYSSNAIAYLMEFTPNLRTVSVIWNTLPDAKSKVNEDTVQPRWELEEDWTQMGQMVTEDPVDGTREMEEGDVQEWMEEIEDALSVEEIPEHSVDPETGEMLVSFLPVRAVQR